MAILSVYVDEETRSFLARKGVELQQSIEMLAEAAIAEYCLELKRRELPPRKTVDVKA